MGNTKKLCDMREGRFENMRSERETAYQPTPEEIERVRPQPDMLKVSGDGIFATLQGEGMTAGKPSVFLRLHYCNLTCGVPDGWVCDTGYTWDRTKPEFWQEPEDWSYADTAFSVSEAWKLKFGENQEKRLIITGGEPLLQQRKIAQLIQKMPDWEVEIETNGTISPIPELHNCQFNCSPKLENSGNSLKRRYRPGVLRVINGLPNSQFKFVVVKPSDLSEIDHIVEVCELDPEKIYIMPEGQTEAEVEQHAMLVRHEVEERGWKVAMRNQLIWYGHKRRT